MPTHEEIRALIKRQIKSVIKRVYILQTQEKHIRDFLTSVKGRIISAEHRHFVQNYFHSILIRTIVEVRTFDDQDDRSFSLLGVMQLVSKQSCAFNREWYLSVYPDFLQNEAGTTYNDWCTIDKPEELDCKLIAADVRDFKETIKDIRFIVNKTIAHNVDISSHEIPQVTVEKLFTILNNIYRLTDKYLLIIDAGSVHPIDENFTASYRVFAEAFCEPVAP